MAEFDWDSELPVHVNCRCALIGLPVTHVIPENTVQKNDWVFYDVHMQEVGRIPVTARTAIYGFATASDLFEPAEIPENTYLIRQEMQIHLNHEEE